MRESERHQQTPTAVTTTILLGRRRPSPTLAALALPAFVLGVLPAPSPADDCAPSNEAVSLEELVARVEGDGLRYVFVGERHGSGPVKRFAVELANALDDRGRDSALYIEGFRTNCAPSDAACWSLARWFNPDAFGTLLEEARVPVRPLDPPERDARGLRMAETIAAGSESVRVVLVGRSHVRFAGKDQAEVRVFGGAVRFSNPGDVVEAFPRSESLTIGLVTSQTRDDSESRLLVDGCEFDLVLSTAESRDYWAGGSGPAGVVPATRVAATDVAATDVAAASAAGISDAQASGAQAGDVVATDADVLPAAEAGASDAGSVADSSRP